MDHESILSRLPILINTMAVLLAGESTDARKKPAPGALPRRLAADLRKRMSASTREDAGLIAIEHYFRAFVDPSVQRRLTKWLSRVRRSNLFRRATALALEVRGFHHDSSEFECALALLECLGSPREPGDHLRMRSFEPPAPVRRALCTVTAKRQALPDAHVAPLNDLLRRLIMEALSRFDFHEGSVLLYDEERHDLFFHLSASPVAEKLAGLRVPIEGSIAGSLLHTRQAAYIADVLHAGQHYGQVDLATGVKTESILGAPLLSRDRPFGVIELVNRKTREPCRQDDIEAFMKFADAAQIIVKEVLGRQAVVDCLVRCLKAARRSPVRATTQRLAAACRRWPIGEDVRLVFRAAAVIQDIAESGGGIARAGIKLLRRFRTFARSRGPQAVMSLEGFGHRDG